MKTPMTSKHFERVVDPISGAPHYVLKTKVAKYQQTIYYVNNAMSRDGRYLWFWATVNPIYKGGCRLLGYVDFLTDEVVYCPDVCTASTPFIDPDDGTAYFPTNTAIYKREPGRDKMTELVCTIPITGPVVATATHITRTSDKNKFFLDIGMAEFGGIQGLIDIRDGSFTEWCRTERPHNHGQLNPKNDDLALMAYDGFNNLVDGKYNRIPYDENGVYQRLWTLTSDGERKMWPPMHNYATHGWWSADGNKIYYCCDNHGIYGIDIRTGENITVLDGIDPWHAFSSKDDSLFVYDEKKLERYGGKWYRGCPAAVNFLNRRTGKHLVVISEMPENGHTPDNQNYYHIDPHPRFTENEKYIVFSTSELGGCDLAVAVVDELVELTK